MKHLLFQWNNGIKNQKKVFNVLFKQVAKKIYFGAESFDVSEKGALH